MKVRADVQTSSPGDTPRQRYPRCSAAVPEAVASTWPKPVAADNAASKAAGTGPAGATQPLASAPSSAAISPPVRCGGESSTCPTGRAQSTGTGGETVTGTHRPDERAASRATRTELQVVLPEHYSSAYMNRKTA